MEKTIHDPIHLPPGFRFHPSDEELITHYLSHKAINTTFTSIAIGEVDLNKVEPWELPWRAKMGEKEWYFFCMRDRKYPTGMRTNRATREGYWKATGKDKAIFRAESLVGMKKTLVFYRGRAPTGVKTNWVMHEFRLEGKQNLIKSSQNEWVICRVYMKTFGGKKVHISSLISSGSGSESSVLPPLTEFSSAEVSNETCLKNYEEKLFEDLNSSLSFSFPFPQISTRNSGFSSLIKNTSTGDSAMVDLDCLWDY